jgi:hypothetical protein
MGLVVMTFRMDFEKKFDELSTAVVFSRPVMKSRTVLNPRTILARIIIMIPSIVMIHRIILARRIIMIPNTTGPYESKNRYESLNYIDCQYKLNHMAFFSSAKCHSTGTKGNLIPTNQKSTPGTQRWL